MYSLEGKALGIIQVFEYVVDIFQSLLLFKTILYIYFNITLYQWTWND